MKDYRIMLFGIALILFGIACYVMLINYTWAENFLLTVGRISPFIGIIVTAVGLFTTDNK
ncbi:MAG: hypothetical protein PWP55_438 [Clostridiales bacterium]|jgi:hypothetical protein|nr:hypothetical protein [Clostridiales bacterium]